MSKTRLLVLTSTFPRWPNDNEPSFVYDLCRFLEKYEIYVVAPHAPNSTIKEIMEGVNVHRFHYAPDVLEHLAFNGGITANLKKNKWNYLLLPGFFLAQLVTAYRIAKKYNIHYIHAHWIVPTGILGIILLALLPKKRHLLVTAHGGDVHQLQGTIFRYLRRWITHRSDHISVVSHSLKKKAEDEMWPQHKISIAPMGVDLHKTFIPKPEHHSRPTLVFAGRLVPKKGVQHLIQAMKIVVSEIPDCLLLIAGDGPLANPLRNMTKELDLSAHINFVGKYRHKTLPSIFHQGDIAVLPFVTAEDGDAEGLGLTTVEAIGCGLPVIVGDVPSIHDIVQHEINGLIVTPQNTLQLAEQIIRLINNPKQRETYAKNARDRCLKKFDWAVCAERYSEILGGL